MERTPRCPASDRYSLLHDGNSHVLDHLLVSPSHAFDVIHISTEFTSINQAAYHDSQAAC